MTREGPLDFDIMVKGDSFLDKYGNGVSENLAMDEKTSCRKGFTALRLENEIIKPGLFCR